jgi:hypothetical protein
MTRIDVATTLGSQPATWVRVCGPLDDHGAVSALQQTVGLLPLGATIVVHVDHDATLSGAGVSGLVALSYQISTDHGRLIIVVEDVDQRAQLVLAEVDRRATLLHSAEQAAQLLGHAA